MDAAVVAGLWQPAVCVLRGGERVYFTAREVCVSEVRLREVWRASTDSVLHDTPIWTRLRVPDRVDHVIQRVKVGSECKYY